MEDADSCCACSMFSEDDCSLALDEVMGKNNEVMDNCSGNAPKLLSFPIQDNCFDMDNSDELDDRFLSEANHYQARAIDELPFGKNPTDNESNFNMGDEQQDEKHKSYEAFHSPATVHLAPFQESRKQSSSRRLLMDPTPQSSMRSLLLVSHGQETSTELNTQPLERHPSYRRLLDFGDDAERIDNNRLLSSSSEQEQDHPPKAVSLLRQKLMTRQPSSRRRLLTRQSSPKRALLLMGQTSSLSTSRRKLFASAKQCSSRRLLLARQSSSSRRTFLAKQNSSSGSLLNTSDELESWH